mmetsp:Transcript_8123/g.16466  ORF Transcript_8123/g.16466 Transcript_8123/m.16466 type:complete len:174 (-) Transcript_8123:330-851(-)
MAASMGWEDAVTNWQEIPKGGINRGPNALKKIWYNPAVRPANNLSRPGRLRGTFRGEADVAPWNRMSPCPLTFGLLRVSHRQIIPLWGAIGLAGFVCGGFMIKYFGGHTEIAWSKSLRATFDHQGLSESRVASHNSHFGMREMNKKNINIFPFNYLAMQTITDKHKIDYPTTE